MSYECNCCVWSFICAYLNVFNISPNGAIAMPISCRCCTGAGHAGDAFHLAAKVNQCVVCGSQDSLKRMYIVPRMFRRLFPVGAKCHTSHDVVLLCAPCHMAADRAQSALVKRTVDCLPMMRARAAKKEGDSGSGPPRSFDETLDAARDSPSVTSLGECGLNQRRQHVLM